MISCHLTNTYLSSFSCWKGCVKILFPSLSQCLFISLSEIGPDWRGVARKKVWNRVFCCHFFWWLSLSLSSSSLSNLSPAVCEKWAYGKEQRCCVCMVRKIIHSWFAELCLHKKAVVFLVGNVLEKVSMTISSKRTFLSWGSLLKNVRCLSNSPLNHHYLVINFWFMVHFIQLLLNFFKKCNLTTILIKEKDIGNSGEQMSWNAFCWE